LQVFGSALLVAEVAEALASPRGERSTRPKSVRLPAPAKVEQTHYRSGRAARRDFILLVACLTTSYLAMPFVYAMVAFHGAAAPLASAQVDQFILLNCTANAAVLLCARGLHGRLDQKFTGLFYRTAFFGGLLAFFTLVFRRYYSIPMLLTDAVASLVLGAAVVVAHARWRPLVIGVLGPWHPMLSAIRPVWRMVEGPGADIRPYDLLVTTFVDGLSPKWTPAVSRALLAGKPVRHAAQFLEESKGVVSIEHFHVDHIPEGGLASYRIRKRALELAVVITLGAPALILLGAGCLIVAVTMGRPVFFVQQRIGQGGRAFRMYKLRTMFLPRPVNVGTATSKADPRVTPVGRWLRRFHIDELPQLWNVLIGDMSIVGPRPEQPALAEEYRLQIPAFAYRLMVRPGITGWAQVRAGYAADVAETRVKLGYDLFYLKNFSFALDLQILMRTIGTLVTGGGVR
jgi:lipopolysaccharide/colanic/teichoic acid biosynthesis glycosyltransferase